MLINKIFKLIFLFVFFNLLAFTSYGATYTLNEEKNTITISKDSDAGYYSVLIMQDEIKSYLDGQNVDIKDISTVKINNDIEIIGDNAFKGFTGLKSVTIPDSVTEICYGAFSGCTSLTEITIPDSVTNIGYGAFERCSSLKSVKFGDNSQLGSIESSAFSGCTSLTEITIPSSVTYISNNTFSGCTNLTKITISEGVTYIGYGAFSGCTSLTEITIPSNVTNIGYGAFERCSSLKSVKFGDNSQLGSIDSSAFSGCTSLTEITIPSSVTYISNNAFEGCTSLKEIEVDVANTNYISVNGVLFSKDGTNLKLVSYPAGKTYTPYTIPDSVASGGANYNVTEIGEGAFSGCTGLKSVTIPKSVTNIGYGAFERCSSLKSVKFGDNSQLGSIDSSAFSGCTSLTEITISKGVTNISNNVFEGCTSLKEIKVDEGNTKYKSVDGVLFSKDGTTLVRYPAGKGTPYTIPDSVTEICYGAFSGCTSLKEIKVDEGNTKYKSVDGVLFSKDGTTLVRYPAGKDTSYTIPKNVTNIGDGAFSGCTSLKEIKVGDGNTNYISVDGVLYGICSKGEYVRDEESEECMLVYYPAGKEGKTYEVQDTVTINNKELAVTGAIHGAFSGCKLTSIMLPKGFDASNFNSELYGFDELKCIYYKGNSMDSKGGDGTLGTTVYFYDRDLTLHKKWSGDETDGSKRGVPEFQLLKNGTALDKYTPKYGGSNEIYKESSCKYDGDKDVFDAKGNINAEAKQAAEWIYTFKVYIKEHSRKRFGPDGSIIDQWYIDENGKEVDPPKYSVAEYPMAGYTSNYPVNTK